MKRKPLPSVRRTLAMAVIRPVVLVGCFGAGFGLVEFVETFDTTPPVTVTVVEWEDR